MIMDNRHILNTFWTLDEIIPIAYYKDRPDLLRVEAAMRTQEKTLRKSGISVVGDIPWGSRLCLLYHSADDLVGLLIPYFKAGLINNEFCLWVTSAPLPKEAAERALRKAVPNFNKYLENGQME